MQAVVNRQSLVNLSREMQPDTAVDDAEIGIKVVCVPLEMRAGGLFGISRAIIHAHGDNVFVIAEMHVLRDVDAVGIDPVFGQAHRLAVNEDLRRLAEAFELEKHLASGSTFRELEMLAVECQALVAAAIAPAVGNDGAK